MIEKLQNIAFIVIKPIMIFFLSLFFEKKYLTGRYFVQYRAGYFWALKAILHRNILRLAPPLPFPAHYGCNVSNAKNIHFHPDELHNFQGNGMYFQNFAADIEIGRNVYIAQNVAIITSNHDLSDPSLHVAGRSVAIGPNCWIGFGAVILPGVRLGPNITVAGNAVVTKSFERGNCVIGGVPAVIIREKNIDL